MLKVKAGFILRKLGDEYMVVSVGDAAKDFNGIIRMNETGAFFWKELSAGTTEAALIDAAMAHYDGLDEKTARRDVRRFLDTIHIALDAD